MYTLVSSMNRWSIISRGVSTCTGRSSASRSSSRATTGSKTALASPRHYPTTTTSRTVPVAGVATDDLVPWHWMSWSSIPLLSSLDGTHRRYFSSPILRTESSSSLLSSPSRKSTNNGNGGKQPPQNQQQQQQPKQQRRIPVKHSFHQPPRKCIDYMELQDGTTRLLETPVGQLIPYPTVYGQSQSNTSSLSSSSLSSSSSIADERKQAWALANETIQYVEYLLRGHASYIPGTVDANQQEITETSHDIDPHSIHPTTSTTSTTSTSLTPLDHAMLSYRLLQRMQQEGIMYMDLRRERRLGTSLTTETSSTSTVMTDKTDTPNQNTEDTNIASEQDDVDRFFEGSLSSSLSSSMTVQYDFAPPGPTTAMYNVVLDAIAVVLESVPFDPTYKYPWRPMDVAFILQQCLHAHQWDGGDQANTNPYTRPTRQSYNAVLRAIANVPYHPMIPPPSPTITTSSHDEEPSTVLYQREQQEQFRDEALTVALGTYNAMSHTKTFSLGRNSATMCYILKIVGRYLLEPSSSSSSSSTPSIVTGNRTRGNVAVGLYHHAKKLGLIDKHVIAALAQTNIPSNHYPDMEQFIQQQQHLLEQNLLSAKWRRNAKSSRELGLVY